MVQVAGHAREGKKKPSSVKETKNAKKRLSFGKAAHSKGDKKRPRTRE